MAVSKRTIDKYLNEIQRDGKAFLKMGFPSVKDNVAIQLIEKNDSPYAIGDSLRSAGNFHLRITYSNIISKQSGEQSIKHAWSLKLLGSLFRECNLLERFKNYKSVSSLLEEVGGCGSLELWDLVHCLCGRYALGMFDGWARDASLFEIFDLRGDLAVCVTEDTYRFPFEMMRFLSVDKPGALELERLNAQVPQLSGVASAWQSDAEFSELTEKWCDWHVKYSEEKREEIWGLAKDAHDFLFPSWIFALDRCRQNVFGRSALGQHELIDYGKFLISVISKENSSPPRVLIVAQEKYNALYGAKSISPLSFWKSHLKHQSHPGSDLSNPLNP
jgi:hypothetical protein